MVVEKDLVRQAVLSSIRNDARIEREQQVENEELKGLDDIKKKGVSKVKGPVSKRARLLKGDSNWMQLQKTLPKTRKFIKKKVRTGHASEEVVKDETGVQKGRYSSFMKREVHDSDDVTRVVAMDCEMVGVGPDGKQNALARVSIVNYVGDVLYDRFVKVVEPVTDYRTQWSGVRPENIADDSETAVHPFEAQKAVGELIKGRLVVGHALKNDMRVLRLAHPWRDVRDTSDFYKKLWRKQGRRGGRAPALRAIVAQVLGVDSFQKSEHDSCEDARAALALYKRSAKEWESDIRQTSGSRKGKGKKREK